VAALGLLQPVGPDSEVHLLPALGGGSAHYATRRAGNDSRPRTPSR
jgi:hypothetical protein